MKFPVRVLLILLIIFGGGVATALFTAQNNESSFTAAEIHQSITEPNTMISETVRSKVQSLSALEQTVCKYMAKEDPLFPLSGQSKTFVPVLSPEPTRISTEISKALHSFEQRDNITKQGTVRRVILKVKQTVSAQPAENGLYGAPLQKEDLFFQIQQNFAVKEVKKLFPIGFFARPDLSPENRRAAAVQDASAAGLDRLYSVQVQLRSDETPEAFVNFCNQLPQVEYAEMDHPLFAHGFPDDPDFPIQWHLNNTAQDYPASGDYNPPPGVADVDIDAPEAWDVITDCNDIIIAIIDTGVDYLHPDIADNMWVNHAELNGTADVDDDENGYIDDIYGYNMFDQNGDPRDDNGHGTHCAGIIAARGNNTTDISGVCWSARIMALKFLNRNGVGSTLDSIEAIIYAVQNGAKIISNSYGGPYSSRAAQEAIEFAVKNGVVFVASAGNDGVDLPLYPAAYDRVLSVAATDSTDHKAVFSSFGNWVDLAAPGVDILSLRAEGTALGTVYNDTTTIASGTSMACPVVAGTCGLLLGINSTLTSSQVQLLMFSALDPIDDFVAANNGRLNAYKTLAALFGQVQFGQNQYSCSSDIDVWVCDFDLAGQGDVSVMLQSDSVDSENLKLIETDSVAGFFTGSLPAASGPAAIGDGILQILHDQDMSVSYMDESDIDGNAVMLTDIARADCEGPVVSDLDVHAPGSVVTIRFLTDEPAKANLKYGLSCDDLSESHTQSESFLTEHVMKISHLMPESVYYFILEVEDGLGNVSVFDNGGLCFLFTTSSILGNLYVPDDFPTIRSAVDRAWDGDTIWLGDGIYSGPGNYNIHFEGKQITVKSINGADNCIMDCDSLGRGFILNNDPNAMIEGITIVRGYSKTNVNDHIQQYLEGGSGIYAFQSHVIVNNCVFLDNFARGYGGAVYIDGGDVQILDCTFTGNQAVAGGAVSVEGVFERAQVNLQGCTTSNNHSEFYGGAIDFRNASVTISDCSIRGNTVKNDVLQSRGGGVYAGFDSDANLSDCHISDNDADLGGGVGSVSSRSFQAVNCSMVHNQAVRGGGVFVSDCNAVLSNSLVLANTAEDAAGLMQWNQVNTVIENCTFTQNTADQIGGGVVGIYDSNSILVNSVLWGNFPESEQIYINDDPERPNRMDISYCDVQGATSGVYDPNTDIAWGPGIISDDPLVAFEQDAHLLSGSPCIDQGTSDLSLPQLTDLEGTPRAIDGNDDGLDEVDIGAYEFDAFHPVIALSESVLTLQGTAGAPVGPSASFQLRNPGGGTLSWEIDPSEDWIQVTPTKGGLDDLIADIQVQIEPSGLAGGDYQGELIITSPSAVNSPRKILIDLYLSGTLYVPSQYPTIQGAIDAARDGDTILVADGIYRGLGNRDIEFNGKGIYLKSQNGPDKCIINVQGSEDDPHRAFTLYDSLETNDSVIQGFTLTGGHAGLDFFKIFPPFDGGAIWCSDSHPVIKDCIIRNNEAYDSGGAATLVSSDLPDNFTAFENCFIFYNNSLGNIGNIAGGGGLWIADLVYISNSVVAKNFSKWNGGGIWIVGANQKILSCTIVDNLTMIKGGGVYVLNSFQDPITSLPHYFEISNSIFHSNHAAFGNQLSSDYNGVGNTPPKGRLLYSNIPSEETDLDLYPGTDLVWEGRMEAVDPLFVDPEHENYRLLADSALIDTGRNALAFGFETDLDGNPRFLDADYDGLPQVDLGAYEFVPVPFEGTLIEISDWEFDFTAYQGEHSPPPQTFRIRNSGTGMLQWKITDDCPWLIVSPPEGESAGEAVEVTLQPDITGLSRGLYTCQLAIESPLAANHPRTFTVNLRIFERGKLHVPSEYSTIQQAINAAAEHDQITIEPGIYEENLYIQGKNITLRSQDPNDWAIVSSTIIFGSARDPVVTFQGTEQTTRLVGLTLSGGSASESGGGIQGNQTRAQIERCIIRDNRATQSGGGIHAVWGPIFNCRIENNTAEFGGGLADCNDVFNSIIVSNQGAEGGGLYNITGNVVHCTVSENIADKGAGLSRCSGIIYNCIIWANHSDSLHHSSQPSYSCIQGRSPGLGNLDIDPEFVDPETGDYRLAAGSFCIDAAGTNPEFLPGFDIDGLPRPLDGDNNGPAIPDMGAYEMPVSDRPVIGISEHEFIFTNLDSDTQVFQLWNAGLPPTHYTIDDPNCSWLSVSPTSGSVNGSADTITLTVHSDRLLPGLYECRFNISDPEAINSPRSVYVQLKVLKDTIYLTPEGPAIQQALNYVTEGGTLILADGVYSGPGNRDVDFLGTSATVKSENGPSNCIIDLAGDPNNPHRAFLFRNNEGRESVIEGLTIMNGYNPLGGAAIYCNRTGPMIHNCVFENNNAVDDLGGGVYSYSGSPVISGSLFRSNAAQRGGAISNIEGEMTLIRNTFVTNSAGLGGAVYNHSGSVAAHECLFTRNSADDGGAMYNNETSGELMNCLFMENNTTYDLWYHGGGAIFNRNSDLTIQKCIFRANQSAWDGGALENRESSPIVDRCVFIDNQALGNDGGAVFNIINSHPMIARCTFTSNHARSWGGAMRNRQSSPRIENSLFVSNDAIDNGGAIFNFSQSNPEIIHCTFALNTANGNGGGAMYSLSDCTAGVVNSIFWDNEVPQVFDEDALTNISFSNIDFPGDGNMDQLPQFMDPNNDDFRLDRTSPCIDAGTAVSLAQDLDGKLRPWDCPWATNSNKSSFDMGAYEFLPVSVSLKITPQAINTKSKGSAVRLHLSFSGDISPNVPEITQPILVMTEQTAFVADGVRYSDKKGRLALDISIPRNRFRELATGSRQVPVSVTGVLTDGRIFSGTDTVRVMNK